LPDRIASLKRVGSTSLSLPAFGLGTAHLGELYGKVAEADSDATAWASTPTRRSKRSASQVPLDFCLLAMPYTLLESKNFVSNFCPPPSNRIQTIHAT
jgi:hypothetical protein